MIRLNDYLQNRGMGVATVHTIICNSIVSYVPIVSLYNIYNVIAGHVLNGSSTSYRMFFSPFGILLEFDCAYV